jgi:hypothetical protein
MGYKPQRKKYQLIFDESFDDLKGLEITCEALTLGEARELMDSTEGVEGLWKKQDHEHEAFIKCVLEWNLEGDDGDILDITVDNFRTLPAEDVKVVVVTWFQRCLGVAVPAPLGNPSIDGNDIDEMASIPMEAL